MMALKQPQPVSPWKAVYLCALAIVSPARFEVFAEKDVADLETRPNAAPLYRATVLQHPFLHSLFLVVASGLVGLILGAVTCRFVGKSDLWITALQTIGALLLLWATLFVRSSEIDTYSCATLTERVNQWLYRSMYCLGTAILVSTLPWALCS